jgi:hypothetical protein
MLWLSAAGLLVVVMRMRMESREMAVVDWEEGWEGRVD